MSKVLKVRLKHHHFESSFIVPSHTKFYKLWIPYYKNIMLKGRVFKNAVPWYLILLVSIVFVSHNVSNTYAGTTFYDFVTHAPEAYWSSGAGVLPFPGDPADDRGFALYVSNALLEDGSTWPKVLETHPQWVGNGYIMGAYPQQTVPTNVQLTVRIGFLSGATGTDGARFEAYFDEYRGMNVAPLRYTIFSHVATLDGKLDLITKDLSYLAGKKGTFILYVNAGQSSGRDWAVWAEARIEAKALPDLVITDIWENDSQIHYKVKNVGEAATSAQSFCDSLSVDGKQVSKHYVTQVLEVGQEVEGAFDYAWQPTPGEHAIRVCADCEQNVDEANEQNNCLEEKWVKENLPDLVIVEIKSDRNNSIVGYILENIGDEIANRGHSTTLYVDGEEMTHDLVSVDLSPGETYESWFKEYEWPECHNITVKICADNYDQVKESDEGNNFLEKKCVSYPISILITSGPSAVNATQDSVTIVWVSNKKSDSTVRYTDRTTGEEHTVYDPSLVKGHRVILKNLKPRTTYRFNAESKDQCGNSAISKSRIFETGSPPDEENPSVRLYLPERLAGIVNILANASDDVGVGGVMFSIDGVVKLIDFSSPYVWACNTTLFANGIHVFQASAYDAMGKRASDSQNGTIDNPVPDVSPPVVSFLTPQEGDVVHGMVLIDSMIQDAIPIPETTGYIERAEMRVDGVLVRSWEYSPFRYDFMRGEIVMEHPSSDLQFDHPWNTSGLVQGSEHEIEVMAWDDSANRGHAKINVTIVSLEWVPPPLEMRIIRIDVTREVVRHDNYYEVFLYVRNAGTEALYDFCLRDDVSGFQAIPIQPFCNVSYAPSFWDSIVLFKPDPRAALNPGGTATFQYSAVPVLYNPTLPDECYIFGWLPTSTSYSCEGVFHSQSFELAYTPPDLNQAFGSSDYLIVTSPYRLFDANPGDREGVNSLLVEAAKLAKLKSGVLGYIGSRTTNEQLKGLISPLGDWAGRLSSVYGVPDLVWGLHAMGFDVGHAYLLIVGEEEVVPSFPLSAPGFFEGDTGGVIKHSDHPYADVCGDDCLPDLIVGRIIGDTARDLIIPIKTSIAESIGLVEYDGSNALVVSGDDYTWEQFTRTVFQVGEILRGKGVGVERQYWEYYTAEKKLLVEALLIGYPGSFDEDASSPQPNPWDFDMDRLVEELVTRAGVTIPPHTSIYTTYFNRAMQEAERIEEARTGGDYGTYEHHFTDVEAEIERCLDFKALTRSRPYKDVIFFTGHGDPGSWCGGFANWAPPCPSNMSGLSFGGSAPIILAVSCSTGNYEPVAPESSLPSGIAEAFLAHGAGAYIGSTESSIADSDHGEEYGKAFFREHWRNDMNIGEIFTEFERTRIMRNPHDDGWRYTIYEFNLYGDPKFGG